MVSSAGSVWVAALDRYAARFEVREQEQIRTISNMEALMSQVIVLRKQYSKKITARCFDRLTPIFQWLSGFNHCVQTFTQAAPTAFNLLWGSLSILIEIAARYSRGLEQVVEVLQEVRQVLPRFEAYAIRFLPSLQSELGDSLISYHLELIGIFQDAITFFKRRPVWNFIRSSVKSLKDQIAPRVNNLKSLIYNVDQDAWFSSRVLLSLEQRTYYEETTRMLTEGFSKPVPEMVQKRLPYHSLPARRNSSFFGREDELRRLSSSLQPQSLPTQLKVACVYGLSGAGKTQLALEFAHKHIDEYQVVIWIASETPTKLAEAFTNVAHEVGLTDASLQHADQLRELVKQWLSVESQKAGVPHGQSLKWLLILDNVGDPKHIESYLPCTAKGSVIITTRCTETAYSYASDKLAMVSVEPFSAETGSKFLFSLLDKSQEPDSTDRELAMKMSMAIGNHPLALDLLGCYMRKCGKSLQRFTLEHPGFDRAFIFQSGLAEFTENAYLRFISTTWEMSLSTAGTELESSAILLIHMLAFFDADNVPLSLIKGSNRTHMLQDGPDLLEEIHCLEDILANPLKDTFTFDKALASLRDSALITIDDEGTNLRCHRLVRLAVSNSMSPPTKALIFDRGMFQLNAAFPPQTDGRPLHDQWQNCERVASQVVGLLDSYFAYKDNLDKPILLCDIVARCSWYWYEKGQFKAALELVEKALLICADAMRTCDHPGYSPWFVQDMVSHLINVQATVAREKPAPDHGVSLSNQVCAIRDKNQRPGILDDVFWIAAARGNLALSLMAVGRYEDALEIILDLTTRPDMMPNMDLYLCNACLCLSYLGRLDEALSYNTRATQTIEASKGKDSAQMAFAFFYLGKILVKQGKIQAALVELGRCLQIRKRLMPYHHHTAFTLHSMGVVLGLNKNHEESIWYFLDAISILERCECHHGAVCRTELAVSEAYQIVGDDKSAHQHLLSARSYRARILDEGVGDLDDVHSSYDRFVTVILR